MTREPYGVEPDQIGDWYVPDGDGPWPLVVLVHGGFWRARYALDIEDAVATRLAGEGFLLWNVEYRRGSAPWPHTLLDVAAAYDHAVRDPRVDPTDVSVVGHSAGGHLALWLASRSALTPGGPPAVQPRRVVAQAPVACLSLAHEQHLGSGAVELFVGGSPAEVPERYAEADPFLLGPRSEVTIVHGEHDEAVPLGISTTYAEAHGCRLRTYRGGHFEHLDPASEAVELLLEELRSP